MEASQPDTKNPIWIARETLKHLATQRIAPTPDQYQAIYYQIAGINPPKHDVSDSLANNLLAILRTLSLPQAANRYVVDINLAVGNENWPTVAQLVGQLIQLQASPNQQLERPWEELLLMLWDARGKASDDHTRRDELAYTVALFAGQPEKLNHELNTLITHWLNKPHEIEVFDNENSPVEIMPMDSLAQENCSQTQYPWQQWQALVVNTLRDGLIPRLTSHQHWIDEIEFIIQAIEAIEQPENIDWIQKRLRQCWIHMALRIDQEQRLIDGLLSVLALFVEHLSLPSDLDPWVTHQLDNIRRNLAKPLTLHRIYDAESILKELVYQQGLLQHTLTEAQQTLKAMISVFLERLGVVTEATGEFQHKIDHYTERVHQTSQAVDFKSLLEELMEDTRHMQLDMLRARDELVKTQQQADAAQQRVNELRQQLRQISEHNRDDRLTGALSHRALVETFSAEQSHMSQSGKPLCLALLDVDNLSELNAQLGRQAGDDTLTGLVQVIKTVIREGDSVIRYGSEEFLILLPNTPLSTATDLLRRLQRELTKRFFMNNNKRLLITFSAGVTRCLSQESREQALDRADYAVFLARKQGKNQVAVVEAPEIPVN
ncbi:MAG TPA: GGDEF domain-containing protein [Nitrosomonas sp.]|nr:GGDEF domain-containing protein [Nitrosomonas sp.]